MTQDLLEQPTFVEDAEAVDPEALIEEARQRARRRRLFTFAAILALAAVGSLSYAVIRHGGGNSVVTDHIPHGLVVNARAFVGHGTLAFVSLGKLWVLDGNSGSLRVLPSTGSVPTQPLFSADGKWLAYLQQRTNAGTGDSYARLWIARADGRSAHLVPGLKVSGLFGWNPRSDMLAISTGPERRHQPCPCYSPTQLRVVSPSGSSHIVARAGWVDGAAWSPDGRQLAVAAIGLNKARLIVYPLGGGHGRVWLARHGPQELNGMKSILFSVAGWWPHVGIGVWVYGDGAVRNLDGTPLDAIASAGARPVPLGTTLSDQAIDSVSGSARGDVAVVVDTGGGRAAWQDKHVELCSSTTHACHALPLRPGTVTVDPAWLPDGRLLYAEAPNISTGPWSQERIAAWFNAHRLLIYDTASGRTRSIPAAQGATAVTVSRDGHDLLYVRDDALWLLPKLSGQPIRIAAPLFPLHNWPQYYAQVAWSAQYAWSAK
jgi:dipeptidyl aminopeptidase/acylaminoacyl peptidase